MDSREDLPRISVDTVHNWQRVRSNFTNAALSRLDARLAAGTSTTNRFAILQHMNQFIERTFASAEPNLRVNGRNLEDLGENEQEMEPFDEALDRNIWSLSDKRLKLDQEIAAKRRSKPLEVEASLRDMYQRRHAADGDSEMALSGDETQHNEADEDPWEGVSNEFQEVVGVVLSIAEELNQAIPVQRERTDRLKSVTKEVKSLKP